METKENEIILPDDPRAATYHTDIKGWISYNCHFFGNDERMARYDGSTHRICEGCGAVVGKINYCRACYDKKEFDDYLAMPEMEWNEEGRLYSQANDEYYDGWDYALDACEDAGTLKDMRLIIAEPVYVKEIDPSEYYLDDILDGYELPDDIREAFDELNEIIRNSKTILCYRPGKFRVMLP